jgi:hypothetical protein
MSNTPTIITKPILNLDDLSLKRGAHHSADQGMCIMEAVAFMAGERFSDRPECACPIIAAILRRWNDRVGNTYRQELKRYIPLLIGSKSTPEVETKRAWMAVDWEIRVSFPMFLEIIKLNAHADKLRNLSEIKDRATFDAIRPMVYAAREAAHEVRCDINKRYPLALAIDIAIDNDNALDIALDRAKQIRAGLTASAHDLVSRMLAVKPEEKLAEK